MIDLKLLREHPELFKETIEKRHYLVDVDAILALDTDRRTRQQSFDELRAEQKALSKEKPDAALLERLKAIKVTLGTLEEEEKEVALRLEELLKTVPNPIHESVPVGGEDAFRIEKTVGESPKFDFATLGHEELGKRLDVIDTERGAKISGSRFWFLKGKLVQLEYALLQYALSILVKKHGFTLMAPPQLVRERVLYGAGFLPAAKNEIYKVNEGDGDDLYLIGTSEAPLVSYYMDEVIDVSKPVRMCAFTPCYRREAGAYGKDVTGIIRGHQFDKIEMVSLTDPDVSWAEHDFLRSIEEEIVAGLGLPYRVLTLASGDISMQAAKCYDIEAYMPGQGKYREITSCSNTTDFQSRRLNIRTKKGDSLVFVHALNGTAIAMGRMMVAIMENYQQADGTIKIPEVLHQYLDFTVIS